jgi:hypothetical protein
MSRATTRPDPLRVSQLDLDRAKRWPIGQPVTVTQGDGTPLATVTQSAPWKVGALGAWVILLRCDPTHAFPLARVTAR